jgi:hypothetical protein
MYNGRYYIIEGDIRSYFDNVHHRKLMSILRRRIKDRAVLTLIWKFLTAGVMEGPLFAKSENGVPQGGVISPLLANAYLNEFDKWAEERWHSLTPYQRKRKRSNGLGNHIMVRYADDFVVVSNGPITQVRRVKSKGRWAVHLRPTEVNKRRVKRKLKELTSQKWIWLDEYTRLTTLNWIVRGWCEYYRYTSLLSDLEEVTRYTWFRYLAWLLKKHEGSRKKRLIRSKTAKRNNRTRWKAEVREGDKALTRYQWLPTRTELKRQRYPKKGRDGFLHPYLDETPLETDYPTGEVGPSESVYKEVIKIVAVANHSPGWPSKRLRVKMRDDFQCTQCGSKVSLQVHRIKAKESERIEDLMTLCQECHTAETSRRKDT